ncbi:MAG: arabinan endo-1,5-alpha-L-arabinosidase [Capsulimonadales bacterium]|nr:arabinan endo-1,5-alpha-L-arabinosidase [Capsulimonadales bacterium]
MQNEVVKFVHDPCIIREKNLYYVYSTGHGIPIRRSRDLKTWENLGRVFVEDIPEWTKTEIPGSVFPWAPDIAYLNGLYHLYYSVSTFGKNRSAIGLATNKTLDPASKDYAWKDQGKVFESFPSDNYNAIDSNVLALKNRLVFLFGSFWSGIKMVEADRKTGRPIAGAPVVSLARRPSPGAVEAPFLIEYRDWFYLFVSFDFCCRGARSTYNLRVGRSKDVAGPYLDREGVSMLDGGGTVVLQGAGRMAGPGHCAVLTVVKQTFLAHHYYDVEENGVPKLQVRRLNWDREGWPSVGEPLT